MPKKSKFDFEFGGPLGVAGVMAGLPMVMIALFYVCGRDICVHSTESASQLLERLSHDFIEGQGPLLWSWHAVAVVSGWVVVHFALYVYLPGPVAPGVVLNDGKRLLYRLNGHLAFWLSLTACCGLPLASTEEAPTWATVLTPLSLAWLYDHYLELVTASMALSFVVAAYSYVSSFQRGEMLAEGGVSGSALYDFFIGRALNPRIGALDLKCACELRPGLIGWAILNLGMAAKQRAEDEARRKIERLKKLL